MMVVVILLEGMLVLMREDLGQAAPAHEQPVAGPQEPAVILTPACPFLSQSGSCRETVLRFRLAKSASSFTDDHGAMAAYSSRVGIYPP